jgi:hypothetical protein
VRALLILGLTIIVSAIAQSQAPVDPELAQKVNKIWNSLPPHDNLNCKVVPTRASLDFAFRFDAGYFIHCPLKEFAGQDTFINSYIRVTPRSGATTMFSEFYRIGALPPELAAKVDPRKLNATLEMSGGFTVGEGKYLAEIVLMDNRRRYLRQSWNIEAVRKGDQRDVALAIAPDAIQPFLLAHWDGKLADKGHGLRVSVLLDAAPMNPRASKLYAWDRAFLLQSLTSLLEQVPCESVRLVAFNLDQQKEVFREDSFGKHGFEQLARALRSLELGTVNVQALHHGPASVSLLADLANQEIKAAQPADAVILLGPRILLDQKTSSEMLDDHGPEAPKFFYFEFFPFLGAEFPDALHNLTKALHGTVYQIHSPAELGKGIHKMLSQVRIATPASPPDPPASDSPGSSPHH